MNNIDDKYNEFLDKADLVDENKLTDDDVKDILKAIDEAVDPKTRAVLDLPSNNGTLERPVNVLNPETSKIEYEDKIVTQDIRTGKFTVDGNVEEFEKNHRNGSVDMNALINQDNDLDLFEKKPFEFIGLCNRVSKEFGLGQDDTSKVASLINKYKCEENIDIYDELPETLRGLINSQCVKSGACTKQVRYNVTKSIIDKFIMDYEMELFTIDIETVIDDFIKEQANTKEDLNKEMGNMVIDMFMDRLASLEKIANEYEQTGEHDKASVFTNISKTYRESFELNGLYDFIKSGVKIKKIEVEKPSRVFLGFNQKYINNKLDIYDISECPEILTRHIDKKYSINDITKLCIAFCKYCKDKDPEDVIDHIFMYYFTKNIVNLDSIRSSIGSNGFDLYHEFLNNLSKCIDLFSAKG